MQLSNKSGQLFWSPGHQFYSSDLELYLEWYSVTLRLCVRVEAELREQRDPKTYEHK